MRKVSVRRYLTLLFSTPGLGLTMNLLGFETPLLSDPVGLSMTDMRQNGV